MNRWTNKYSYGPGGAANTPVRLFAGRMRTVLLVLLTIAVVLLAIFGGSAIAYRNKCDPTFIQTMQTECEESISAATTLSQSVGGKDYDNVILSRIRAHISAIETINELRGTFEGGEGYFVEPAVFTNLYRIIDDYYANKGMGSATSADLDKLKQALNALNADLYALR